MSITNSILFKNYSSNELKKLASEIQLIILPIGSIEQHGSHLPVDTDTFIAYNLALILANKLNKQYKLKALVIPPIYYGVSIEWLKYPGTITLRPSTLSMIVEDVILSLITNGLNKILILNAHGGNVESIRIGVKNAMMKLQYEGVSTYIKVIIMEWWKVIDEELRELFPSTPIFTHADEIETSMYLALGGKLKNELKTLEMPLWLSIEKAYGGKVNYYDTKEIKRKISFTIRDVDELRRRGLKLLEAFCRKAQEIIVKLIDTNIR